MGRVSAPVKHCRNGFSYAETGANGAGAHRKQTTNKAGAEIAAVLGLR